MMGMKHKPIIWKALFIFCASITIIESSLFLFIFFLIPNSPISMFPSLMKLPAKYLALILIGGFSKEFLMGWFTNYTYNKWKNEGGKKIDE